MVASCWAVGFCIPVALENDLMVSLVCAMAQINLGVPDQTGSFPSHPMGSRGRLWARCPLPRSGIPRLSGFTLTFPLGRQELVEGLPGPIPVQTGRHPVSQACVP